MPYKAADNDYSAYANHILDMLKKPVEQFDFLQNMNITGVFGVSDEFGHLYCKCLQEEFPDEVKKIRQGVYDSLFREFHSIGKPSTFYSDILACQINANTTRYIYHALLIKKYMETKFPDKKLQVIEIGGGYGGLCYWLSKLAPNFIKTYEICDLQAVIQLQKRCLEKWNVSCSYIDNPFSWKKTDTCFLISNYGFSEFNEMFQHVYTQSIISKCEGGFMIWNNWTGVTKFTENTLLSEDERPAFPNAYNKFLYF